jgi:hypothetical protein
MHKFISVTLGLVLVLLGLTVQGLATLMGDRPGKDTGERLESLGNLLSEPDVMP